MTLSARKVASPGRETSTKADAAALEDVLADVLASTRVGGVLTVQAELTAPWGIAFPAGPVAAFHVVTSGQCWLRSDGEVTTRLSAGDVVLFAGGGAHVIGSDAAAPTIPFHALRCDQAQGVPMLRWGGGGTVSALLCGVYRFERDVPHPVISVLPPILHSRRDPEVQSVVALLQREVVNYSHGVRAVLTHLVDLLFVFLVRGWAATASDDSANWLGALRDPQIGRALALVHRAPQDRWTVERIASEVGMSRARFARAFAERVGVSPLAYLTEVRMQRASRLLRESTRPMAEIAEMVGYESEYAFNRAFTRARGTSPGRFRRREQASHQS